LVSGNPSRAHVVGNDASRYFSVRGYRTTSQSLVSTTDAYDGTVLIPSTANFLFEIKAVGHWKIDFT
jgi:hypothetical protein